MARLLSKKGLAAIYAASFFVKILEFLQKHLPNSRKGGSPIDRTRLSLGHDSIQTTEKYLGVEQDLTDSPCDHLGLRIS